MEVLLSYLYSVGGVCCPLKRFYLRILVLLAEVVIYGIISHCELSSCVVFAELTETAVTDKHCQEER